MPCCELRLCGPDKRQLRRQHAPGTGGCVSEASNGANTGTGYIYSGASSHHLSLGNYDHYMNEQQRCPCFSSCGTCYLLAQQRSCFFFSSCGTCYFLAQQPLSLDKSLVCPRGDRRIAPSCSPVRCEKESPLRACLFLGYLRSRATSMSLRAGVEKSKIRFAGAPSHTSGQEATRQC